jgi:hypothetical protein
MAMTFVLMTPHQKQYVHWRTAAERISTSNYMCHRAQQVWRRWPISVVARHLAGLAFLRS